MGPIRPIFESGGRTYELWRRVGRNSLVPGGLFRIFKDRTGKIGRYGGEQDAHTCR